MRKAHKMRLRMLQQRIQDQRAHKLLTIKRRSSKHSLADHGSSDNPSFFRSMLLFQVHPFECHNVVKLQLEANAFLDTRSFC